VHVTALDFRTVTAGPELLEVIDLVYRAGRSAMLHGRPGVGKSELFAAAAKGLGVDFLALDLSVMEPPDLVGLPRIDEHGRTVYAAPAQLPRKGAGLLLLEELNRAPRYMRAPCLQLLTARRCNDYRLPPAWVPFAAVNDAEDGCDVDEIDPALMARFTHVRVEADVAEWTSWARPNGVHPGVITFVESTPDAFQTTSPRDWTYVSDLVRAFESATAGSRNALFVAVAGQVGEGCAVGLMNTLWTSAEPLGARQIVDGYGHLRATVAEWTRLGRNDLFRTTLRRLQNHLQRQSTYEEIVKLPAALGNVQGFLADLPDDLRSEMREWLTERGFERVRCRKRRTQRS
jgi:hypothetical protein